MAETKKKKLTDFENPVKKQGGNILDVQGLFSGALYFVYLGAAFMIGAKMLNVVDKAVPGNITPNNYKRETAVSVGNGFTVI